MKIAILGATGMLGHKMQMTLREDFDVWCLARQPITGFRALGIFDESRFISGIAVERWAELQLALKKIGPEVVINCIGMTTRKIDASNSSSVIQINSWLPRALQEWTLQNKARLIHFSTDCVFSGAKGSYRESDLTDARDLYGLSKTLGEVGEPNALSIRSSIIGREIAHKTELVEWCISQKGGAIEGYRNAIYSGVTTNYMARFIKYVLKNHPSLVGIHQLSSPPISKFELLSQLNQALGLQIRITPNDKYRSDKSLDSTRLFTSLKNAEKPNWQAMIEELASEHLLYEGWAKK
jgi:dTDP-4-dehydrorhamnose reductase